MISVLVADDQALVRGGLRMMVDAHDDLHVGGEARNGREAVERALLHRPDVVLMDVRMPGMDGIEATRRILDRAGPEQRVLLLTTFDLDEYLVRGLRAGAGGFLLKTVSPAALADAVRTVHAGEALVDPAVMQRVIAAYVQAPRAALDAPVALRDLTDRERDVLRLLARGLSNAEIAEQLMIAPATAKTHVGRLLAKLGLRDRVQAVVLAYETGLARAGESPGLSRP
jgi:DNA-binding NarL/FixJ family response regulator